MKTISLKKLIEEGFSAKGKVNDFLKFYHAISRGIDPEEHVVFDCLMTLKEYYEDYLIWYKKHTNKFKKMDDYEIIKAFATRLKEIKLAIDSTDLKKQIIAVDNGINQWHRDFPVVYHMQMSLDDMEEDEEAAKWFDVEELLRSLGRLPDNSPYNKPGRYSGNVGWIHEKKYE